MPSPSSALTTTRPDLAESFNEFDLEMDAMGFIAHRVMPVVEVGNQAGTFGKIPLEELLRARTTKRAPGSGYARDDFEFETGSFACEEHGAEDPVDDREREMYRDFFSADEIAAKRAYSAVMRNCEARVSAAIFNATTWTGASLTTAITHEWDDATNAVPVTDVEAAVQKVYDGSGLWANALIVNRKVFRNLRNCDQVIERINSEGAGNPSKPGDVTEAMLAQVFDLEHIIVGGSSSNSATEGQTATPVQQWSGEYAMVCRVANSTDFREPCVGRTFHWAADGSSVGGTVEQYRDESCRSDIFRVRHDVDEIVLYAAAGHLLSNVTT